MPYNFRVAEYLDSAQRKNLSTFMLILSVKIDMWSDIDKITSYRYSSSKSF